MATLKTADIMKRNINNNPTGRPYCCQIDCNNDATLEIRFSNELEDYTHSCDYHTTELAGTDQTVIDTISI